jgi:coenzyme F420-0:L-glutamate ligase/coenzyme F420-1:gamma-L-glutamate ligase
MSRLQAIAVEGLPELSAGDALGTLIANATSLESGDVVVVAQKAVSKVEDRVRRLRDVEPGAEATELAIRVQKDPALVQLILDESRTIVREAPGALIVETNSGWICANAGIDGSNVPGEDAVTLLPEDGDASARRVRRELVGASGVALAVVIADSFGRPWRLGQADVAIGCAGLAPLEDWRGRVDREGRELTATMIATADELAAAAGLVRGKDAGVPAVVIRGLGDIVTDEDGPGAAALRRPAADDLFR